METLTSGAMNMDLFNRILLPGLLTFEFICYIHES